ncbi:MAG: hypothetical protein VZQ80_06570 [Lachnospiraceae bacterium]|nr:hypothetical protein [Lachnospiraceae bacterium]
MATKALNLKWDSENLTEIKEVTRVYHMTLTEFFKEAARDKLAEMKKDPFYRLTANVEDASAEESQEILDEINSLSDDDLTISSRKKITV